MDVREAGDSPLGISWSCSLVYEPEVLCLEPGDSSLFWYDAV